MDPYPFSAALRTAKDFHLCRARHQHWRDRPCYDYLKTPRPDHGVLLVLHGGILFQSEGQTIDTAAGDMVYLPQGAYYRASFHGGEEGVDNLLLNFTCDGLPPLKTPIRVSKNASPACMELFERLICELAAPDAGALRITGVFHLLLDAICESAAPRTGAQARLLLQAQELLCDERDLPISEVAKSCCISESGLRRLFCEKLGMPPVQYRLQAKLNRAKHLLEATDMSVKEIAAALHFYDEAYFCKLFRAQTGESPGQYMQNKRL